MKKLKIISICFLAFMLIFVVILFASGILYSLLSPPSLFTLRWQTVYVDGVGSFRIPTEWYAEQEGEILYITDKPRGYEDYNLLVIGVIFRLRGAESTYTFPYELFESVERGDAIMGRVQGGTLSNSASVLLREYIINGEHVPRFEFEMFHSNGIARFLVWDRDVVDDETAYEIAKTFRLER